jgi:hypothetical protein
MSTGTNNSSSKIALIVVMIPLLAAAWYAAPWVLPVWWWQNVDMEAIARKHAEEGYTKSNLETEFEFIVFYNPRGGRGSKDPCPYQIIESKPAWKTVYPNSIDEHELLVRCVLVDERDGEPISKMWTGSNEDEGFFKIRGWRFPPTSFGKPKGRPVVVFKGLSMEKLELNKSVTLLPTIKQWEKDDEWEDRSDGWVKP